MDIKKVSPAKEQAKSRTPPLRAAISPRAARHNEKAPQAVVGHTVRQMGNAASTCRNRPSASVLTALD